MLTNFTVPCVWAQTQRGGCTRVGTPPSLCHSSLPVQPPPATQSLRSRSFAQHRDTAVSAVWRRCVASLVTFQIHVNGRQQKKMAPMFQADPP